MALACRIGRDDSRMKALTINFRNIEKKKAFLSERRALKGDGRYHSNSSSKENMPRVLNTTKEGKWVAYRDGKVIITCKRAT